MIGVFGGTFDPVHHGHLRTALEVKEIFSLDKVHLVPCAQPAHRESPLTPPEMRFQMLQLAVQNQPDLVIDRTELDREGYSYMIDTLRSLRTEYADMSLGLFIGMDAFKGFKTWHKWQQLFDFAHVVVLTRPGYDSFQLSEFFSARLTDDKHDLKQKKAGFLYFQSVTQLDISATVIRNIIASDRNPGYLLPESVIEFIQQNKLYLGSS